MTDVMIAFVTARLDEDEAAAKAAAHLPGKRWDFTDGGKGRERDGILWDDDHANVIGWLDDQLDCAAHVARHDPARVLRDIEAQRAIVAAYEAMLPVTEDEPEWHMARRTALLFACNMLAKAWNDHREYDPTWTG